MRDEYTPIDGRPKMDIEISVKIKRGISFRRFKIRKGFIKRILNQFHIIL